MDTALAALLDAPAPVVTAHLDARSDQPKALEQLELRWRNVRRDTGTAPATPGRG